MPRIAALTTIVLVALTATLAAQQPEPKPVAPAAAPPATPAPVPLGKPVVNPLTDTSMFPIAVWAMGDKTAPTFAELGVNLFVGDPNDDAVLGCNNIAKSGCVAFIGWKKYAQDEAKRKAIASSPGFLGWMHGDEPDNPGVVDGEYRDSHVPPAEVIADYQAMKASSTPAPMYLNLGIGLAVGTSQTTSDEVYREFMKSADIVCYDVYPVSTHPNGANRLHLVARGVEHLKALAGERPAWIWLECTAINGNETAVGNRTVYPHELRAEIWMSILYGADGIGYFPHEMTPYRGGPKIIPEELQKEMKLTNRLLHKLAPTLRTGKKQMLAVEAKAASAGQAAEPARVDAALWQKGEDVLIVAVNMKNAAVESATIPVPVEVKEFTVVGQEEQAKVADGKLVVGALKPYEVRLFWTGAQVINQSYRYVDPPTVAAKPREKAGKIADLPIRRDLRKGVYWSRTQFSVVGAPTLTEAPVIDGQLTDRGWVNAETLATFTNVRGTGIATYQTVGVVGRHGGKLYLAFRCVEDFLDELVTNKAAAWQNDCVEIFIDPDNKRSSHAYIAITADGRVTARRTVQDSWGEAKRDDAWKPTIEAKTGRVARGWTVEAAINLEDLGDIAKNPVWGFDVGRERYPAPGEVSSYSIGGFHDTASFAGLAFDAEGPVTLADGKLRNRTDQPVKAMVGVLISAPEPGPRFAGWQDRWRDVANEVIVYQLPPLSAKTAGGLSLLEHDIEQKVPAGGRVRFTLINEKGQATLWEEFIATPYGGVEPKK
jgi:hypothetical protein